MILKSSILSGFFMTTVFLAMALGIIYAFIQVIIG